MSKASKRTHSSDCSKDETKKLKVSDKIESKGHWALGLVSAMEDPNLIICKDDAVTVIKDKYPKAEVHYLVLPNKNIHSLKSVKKKHIELLKHMENVALKLIEEKHNEKQFKLGYHAEASMIRLHLHVISDDMKSECVKTKKHWNSFNTEFFLDSKKILEELEKNGKITLPSSETCKKLLSTKLKCHKCNYIPSTMPNLKRHINSEH